MTGCGGSLMDLKLSVDLPGRRGGCVGWMRRVPCQATVNRPRRHPCWTPRLPASGGNALDPLAQLIPGFALVDASAHQGDDLENHHL